MSIHHVINDTTNYWAAFVFVCLSVFISYRLRFRAGLWPRRRRDDSRLAIDLAFTQRLKIPHRHIAKRHIVNVMT